MASGKESRMKVSAMPSSGATRPAGKSDSCEETLRKGKQPKAEAVREAKSQEGVAAKCIKQQVDGNSDHHKRTKAVWGIEE